MPDVSADEITAPALTDEELAKRYERAVHRKYSSRPKYQQRLLEQMERNKDLAVSSFEDEK